MATYDDLGDGSPFGAKIVLTTDSYTTISFSLNALAIAAIQSSLGGKFAIGGQFLGLGVEDDYTFGYSFEHPDNQLILDGVTAGVPDGGLTISLLGGALMALGALRRKFKQ